MKVIEETRDRLVIRDGPWMMRGMGAVLGAASAGIWLLMIRGHHAAQPGAWVAFVVAGVFGLAALALVGFARDRWFLFERRPAIAHLTVRHLRGDSTREIAFSAIEDVALEMTPGTRQARSSGGSTYRVVFLMHDGAREAWTPFSTNDLVGQAACASAARKFGAWTGDGSSGSAAPRAASPTTMRNLPLLFVFLGLFAAIGCGLFGVELYRLATWPPVPATVMTSSIKTVRGNKGSTYAPVVTYAYRIGGGSYVGTGVLPVSMSSSYGWAQRVAARFQPGSRVVAYVDPSDPSRAYLVHDVSLLPLLFVILPLLFAALFGWIIRVARRQQQALATLDVPIVEAPSLTARIAAPSEARDRPAA